MRKILILVMLICSNSVFATIYQVGSSDTYKQYSELPALTNGDEVQFKKGESFNGFTLTQSGITIGSYGTGSNPIITGLETVPGWTYMGGNIWESSNAVSTLSTLNVVIIDGVNTPMGRHPNTGYFPYQTFSTNVSITSSSVNSAVTNWTGAELVVKKAHWVIDRNPITNHSSGTITYSGGSFYNGIANYGFFIQNDIRTLDSQNEWYYNPTTKKISIYSANQPSIVKVSTAENLAVISEYTNIVIDGLTFIGSNSNAIQLSKTSGDQNITIQNCNVSYSGYNAINAVYSRYLTVSNCTINHTNNTAIDLDINSVHATISRNTITNTGLILGQGGNSSSTCLGIKSFASNALIQYNSIDSTGFNGITFDKNHVLVDKNFVNHSNLLKDDGSGIYTYIGKVDTINVDRVISNNIILNSEGNYEGTDGTSKQAMGIYLDGFTVNVNVENNTVSQCTSRGIYINGAKNINITGNKLSNNGIQIDYHNWGGNLMSGITTTGNYFLPYTPLQRNAVFTAFEADVVNIGTMNNNFYQSFFNDLSPIHIVNANNPYALGKHYTASAWQNLSSFDLTSTFKPLIKYSYTYTENGVNKYANPTFESSASGITTSNCTTAWATDGNLDSGNVKISNPTLSTNASIQLNIGAVETGKTYLVKFSCRSVVPNSNIAVYMIQASSPYTSTPSNLFYIDTARVENQLLITSPYTHSNVNVLIKFSGGDETAWIDNLLFYDVDTTQININDNLDFQYNVTEYATPYDLNNPVIDIDGEKHSGSVIIQPFSSILLFPDNSPPVRSGLYRPLMQSNGKHWGNYLSK